MSDANPAPAPAFDPGRLESLDAVAERYRTDETLRSRLESGEAAARQISSGPCSAQPGRG